MKKSLIIALLTLLLLPLVACEHKELCYSHPHSGEVIVKFDWKNAPDADPATMCVYLFPEDGGEPLRYEFIGKDGGSINVPDGNYRAICMNSDKNTHSVVNIDDFGTFQVTTPVTSLLAGMTMQLAPSRAESAPRVDGTEDERVAMQPDLLWTANVNTVHIVQSNGVTKITFYPEVRVRRCTVEIRNVENLSSIEGISATITSLSGGYLPGIDMLSDDLVTVPFALEAATSTTIDGYFTFFGHCPDEKVEKHVLSVYAILSDGTGWYHHVDVTDQMHDPAQDPYHIRIVLDKLPLPKPIDSGGGFQPSIDDWQEINIPLPM